ncbi:MAG: UDP-N-acetylmuramoyl-L-alanyl-D-glutamate--2,6-diaminopimelate ligase [Cocleimonas sp.]|nr:UDP-N-acetylmuramoyl-L-alanyl-D-glutamate--2,6-diaminopimelate ligase [Cocleimonas sp.]
MIRHPLRYLLEKVKGVDRDAMADVSADLLVIGLTLDSREVKRGTLFVALNGTQAHGMEYALKAQQQGAVAIICESGFVPNQSGVLAGLTIPVIEVEGLAQQVGEIARCYYQILDDKQQVKANYGLKIIGVTGTDGKTTVTHFFAQAMNVLAANQAAVIGTLGIGFPDDLQQATHTTPDVLTVHKTLHQLARKGVEYIAMEVSSHALDQERVNGVDFDVAMLTNLTRDHLDYHGTVENYAVAKQKLFMRSEVNTVVLNHEDDFTQKIVTTLNQRDDNKTVLRYAVKSENTKIDAELMAQNAYFGNEGIEAQIFYADQKGVLNTAVLGWFNLSNLLATLAAMLSLDVKFTDALDALNQVKTVPGRMEKINAADVLVVVDYAHTPGALASVLKALRGHTQQRIFCVFGCGGDRDKGKRPLMANIAEQDADVVIVTDDNPRTENPQSIVQDIMTGFERAENIVIEHNRAKAIRHAMRQAQAGDVVLIAGKGHEQVQIFAHKTEVFDDRQQAAEALQELAA